LGLSHGDGRLVRGFEEKVRSRWRRRNGQSDGEMEEGRGDEVPLDES